MHLPAPATHLRTGSHMPTLALLTPQRAAFTNVQPPTTASRLSEPTLPVGGPEGSELKPRFRTAVPGKGHELTTVAVEVVAATRGRLLPDPRYDRVCLLYTSPSPRD